MGKPPPPIVPAHDIPLSQEKLSDGAFIVVWKPGRVAYERDGTNTSAGVVPPFLEDSRVPCDLHDE
jgi:hypothetical protein